MRLPMGELKSRHQRGYILVAAIFLMIIVALLLVFLLRTGSDNQWSSAMKIQEARAFQAAQSGLEWGIYQLHTGACPASPTVLGLSEADLQQFSVTISCSRNDYTENGAVVSIFELDSVATFGTYGVTPDFIARHLQMTVEAP